MSRFGAYVTKEELRASVKLALPLVIAELGWMFMGIVDTMMVGRLPNSADAIGATGLGNVLYFTVALFGLGILLSLDALVSQAFGAGRLDECRSLLVQGVYVAVLVTPPLMAATYVLVKLLPLAGITPGVMALLDDFLSGILWGTLPLMLYVAFRRYLQSMNLVAPVMFALVTANVVNAAFNWLLIYGNLGFPAMGVKGSAWATNLARAYMFLSLAAYAWWHHRRSSERREHPALRPDFHTIRAIFVLGTPIALQIFSEVTVFALAAVLVGTIDARSLAAHEIALLAASTTFMVPLGVSSAAAVRVGQAMGRNDDAGAARAGWSALLVGASFMALSAAVFVTAGRHIAAAFTTDSAVIALATTLLVAAGVFQIADGIQIVASGALRGAGETRLPMIASTVGYWAAGLPLGYILAFRAGMGALGIWIGFVLALMTVAGILLFVWQKRTARRMREAMLTTS